MDMQIPPLKAFKKLDKEMQEIIIGEIQKDKELQKLQEKLNEAVREQRYWQDMLSIAIRQGNIDGRVQAEKNKAKCDKQVAQLEDKIKNRSDFFVEIWMRKYSKTVLTVRGGMELIDDPKDRDAYIWRMCLSWFLADFLEDEFTEMEAIIRKYYPEEKLGQMQEFFTRNRLVQRYMRDALKEETDATVAFFDSKSHSIKTTMWNIAKAYKKADEDGGRDEGADAGVVGGGRKRSW